MSRFVFPVTILLALLLVLPAVAAADEPIVEVENRSYALIFYPIVPFSQMILTVTGPCDYQYRQVVQDGELRFVLDETTIDGVYRFNVMRNEKIDGEIIEILQRARAKLDDETPRKLCREGKLPDPPLSQSAGFRVFRGKIVWDPQSQEEGQRLAGGDAPPDVSFGGKSVDPFAKDFVINDDLIVDGSACIGFDCVNGESFGFDTIRLKEHNLRIKFDDTSTASSFPRNDWQLTANASANGGADKFSIDDISGNRTPFTVEANARSHSLYVDDGGRIGSRTSTPSVEIHTIDGDTPTLRLQQDGSSGFAPQTWDVAGNETNFFIRDVTNGSQLPFRIRPDAPTSSIFIDVDGSVGLGTSSPDSQLDIEAANPEMRFTGTDSGEEWEIRLNNAGRLNFQVQGSGNNVFQLDDGANANLLQLGINAADQVDITGNLVVSGTITPDYVFEPDYELPSIEEQAEFMWRRKHLPAVAPATPDGRGSHSINVGQRSQGLLEELEKAHIYIEQLHQRLARLEAQMLEQASE